jgi:hypothetical protein
MRRSMLRSHEQRGSLRGTEFVTLVRTVTTVRRPGYTGPVPGLRAVAFYHLFRVAFVVETRA